MINNSKNKLMQKRQDLRDSEIDRLEDFLKKLGPSAMNIEMMNGFFSSLLCYPEMVTPAKYLHYILGENFVFESEGEADEILGLMMLYWNKLASTLQRTIKEDGFYIPVLRGNSEGNVQGNDWAHGLMLGFQHNPEIWSELTGNEELRESIIPIMILHFENDPDPGMRPEHIPEENRESLINAMIVGLHHIYSHFERYRRAKDGATLH